MQISERTKVFEFSAPGSARFSQRPAEVLASAELRIGVEAVGLCGTDLEIADGSLVYFRQGLATFPIVPGHEWVGHVLEVGLGVNDFKPGDRVVGECTVGCGECSWCGSGRPNLCPQRREMGILGLDGAAAETFRFPARAAHHIADTVKTEDAVLVEPLAVACRAFQRLGPVPDEPILVVGAGTIGGLLLQVASVYHEAPVYVIEPAPDRLDRAVSFGAAVAPEGMSFGAVLEASGSPSGIDTAFKRLSGDGRLVLVGLTGRPAVPVAVDEIVVKDQTIIGSLGSPGVWPAAISLIESGRVRPSGLVTHQYEFEQLPEALLRLRHPEPGQGKVIVVHRTSGVDHRLARARVSA